MSFFGTLGRIAALPFKPFIRFGKRVLAGFLKTYFDEAVVQVKELNQLLQSTPPQIEARVRTLEQMIRATDRTLIELLRTVPSAGEFRAVPLGDGRLLAAHPTAGFLYLSAVESWWTPRIVSGRVTIPDPPSDSSTPDLLAESDLVIDWHAGPGFFTLGAISRGANRIVAWEPDPVLRSLLQANVAAHGVADRVEIAESADVVTRYVRAATLNRIVVLAVRNAPEGIDFGSAVVLRG